VLLTSCGEKRPAQANHDSRYAVRLTHVANSFAIAAATVNMRASFPFSEARHYNSGSKVTRGMQQLTEAHGNFFSGYFIERNPAARSRFNSGKGESPGRLPRHRAMALS
jgi:hypothetical protein